MRLAAVFPGQGSFEVGCTAVWRDDDPDGVLAAVGTASGLDVLAEGEREDTGRSTRRGQPVLLAASLASWSALVRAGVRPVLVAGHSLGEYAAAAAAGVLPVPAVARVVAARGRAMADACTTAPGGMAAVVRLDPDVVAELVAEVEGLTAANDNAPGQVVVSGDQAALAHARELVDARGGRFLPLDVEGPFHAPAMAPAVEAVRAAAAAEPTAEPSVPVVSGSLVRVLRTAAEIVGSLVDGILAPVRWREVQQLLAREGVTDLVEVGPGRVLAGLAKRTVPGLRVHSAATPDAVRELAGVLGAGAGSGPGAEASALSVRPVAILGLGAYLPERVVTNDDLAQHLDTSDEWIRSRTGIGERRHAAPDEATSDMALAAAAAALADAGLAASDVDVLIVATTTPDHPIPATAPAVAAGLGLEVAAFDLNAACSGFVYGLDVGSRLAEAGATVLLVGAETLTRYVDPGDRSIAVLFGDGAGAVVLRGQEGAELGPFDLGSDGSDISMLWMRAGAAREPFDPVAHADPSSRMSMRGGDVYRHAVARMTASSQAVLAAAGRSVADVDLMVGHQANLRILAAVAERLGLPEERCQISVDRHGNTSAASIPLALADARAQGRLAPGTRLLLTAFGGGLTWGSCLVTWGGR